MSGVTNMWRRKHPICRLNNDIQLFDISNELNVRIDVNNKLKGAHETKVNINITNVQKRCGKWVKDRTFWVKY